MHETTTTTIAYIAGRERGRQTIDVTVTILSQPAPLLYSHQDPRGRRPADHGGRGPVINDWRREGPVAPCSVNCTVKTVIRS